MEIDEFFKWAEDNNISIGIEDLAMNRVVKTAYDKGFTPVGYEEYCFFQNYKDIKQSKSTLSFKYKNKEYKIEFMDDGSDLMSQFKMNIENKIKESE